VATAYLEPVHEYQGDGVLLPIPAPRHGGVSAERDVLSYCYPLLCTRAQALWRAWISRGSSKLPLTTSTGSSI